MRDRIQTKMNHVDHSFTIPEKIDILRRLVLRHIPVIKSDIDFHRILIGSWSDGLSHMMPPDLFNSFTWAEAKALVENPVDSVENIKRKPVQPERHARTAFKSLRVAR